MGNPERRCLACRSRKAKDRLVRLALVEATVVVDPSARQPGRGAYLCPRQECLEAALRRDGTAVLRALRGQRPGVTLDTETLRRSVARAGSWDDDGAGRFAEDDGSAHRAVRRSS